jgi:hypothetical protein
MYNRIPPWQSSFHLKEKLGVSLWSVILIKTDSHHPPNYFGNRTLKEQVVIGFQCTTKVTIRVPLPFFNILSSVRTTPWAKNHIKIRIFSVTLDFHMFFNAGSLSFFCQMIIYWFDCKFFWDNPFPHYSIHTFSQDHFIQFLSKIIPLISNNRGQPHFKVYHPFILSHLLHRDIFFSTLFIQYWVLNTYRDLPEPWICPKTYKLSIVYLLLPPP